LFQKQWKKRKTFYKKQNYKIIYTDIINYQPNTELWNDITGTSKSKDIDEEECGFISDKEEKSLKGKCLLLDKLKKKT
jgi:hypothetical protein